MRHFLRCRGVMRDQDTRPATLKVPSLREWLRIARSSELIAALNETGMELAAEQVYEGMPTLEQMLELTTCIQDELDERIPRQGGL